MGFRRLPASPAFGTRWSTSPSGSPTRQPARPTTPPRRAGPTCPTLAGSTTRRRPRWSSATPASRAKSRSGAPSGWSPPTCSAASLTARRSRASRPTAAWWAARTTRSSAARGPPKGLSAPRSRRPSRSSPPRTPSTATSTGGRPSASSTACSRAWAATRQKARRRTAST